jgi:hypothetical protein
LLTAIWIVTLSSCKKDESNPMAPPDDASIPDHSLSFTSDRGDFSANGVWSDSATSDSMVGGWREQSSGIDYLYLIGIKFNTPVNIDLTVLWFQRSGKIVTGTYGFPSLVSLAYVPGIAPTDTDYTSKGYVMTSGFATLSTFTSSNARGRFSGSGIKASDFSPMSVSNGMFNVDYVHGTPPGADTRMEYAVRRLAESLARHEDSR